MDEVLHLEGSMLYDFNYTFRLIALIIFMISAFYLYKKKNKSLSYIVFGGLFYLYFMLLINYTQFPIITDLAEFETYYLRDFINFIPLNPFTDINRAFLLNIILTVPFGFFIPFLKKVNFKKIVLLGLILTISIELTQLSVWLIFGAHLRYIDINDIVANLFGVLIGYGIFKLFSIFIILIINRFIKNRDSFMNFIYNNAKKYYNS
jgi:glycopeptide antibiotics resistance protein